MVVDPPAHVHLTETASSTTSIRKSASPTIEAARSPPCSEPANGSIRPDATAAYNWGPGNMDLWIAGGRNTDLLPFDVARYVALTSNPRYRW